MVRLTGKCGMDNFWESKRVLVTGHTGFKGGWLSLWLGMKGANILGYALEAETEPSFFDLCNIRDVVDSRIGDIRDLEKMKNVFAEFKPEIVFHLAAQPLVRKSYVLPIETYDVNVIGTAKVLEALRAVDTVAAIVCITTDKCYKNHEWAWPYRETDSLGGYDPYSSSKAGSELVVSAYRSSFFDTSKVGMATARAGNVIGGGDFSEDRLLPDFFRSIAAGEELKIRSPKAIRPWQHVLDPLHGYMRLAEALFDAPQVFSDAWNFGPEDADARSVEWIVKKLCDFHKDAEWSLEDVAQPHEAGLLKLDSSKAKQKLSWKPNWSLGTALEKSSEWFDAYRGDMLNLSQLSRQQIDQFETSLASKS